MLKNYFLIASRSLARQRLYSFINITGMAIGLASAILILLFVHNETSYESFHSNQDRIFRATIEEAPTDGAAAANRLMLSPAIGPAIREAFPEIEAMARLTPVGPRFSYEDQHITGDHVFWSDPDVFDVLDINVLIGDARKGLEEPFTVALSESFARRLFGDTDPVGQSVIVNGSDPFTVVAVFEDMPENSHIHFDALGAISTLDRWFSGPSIDLVWDSPNYVTYIRINDPANVAELSESLSSFLASVDGRNIPKRASIRLQNITDIHLNSTVMRELEPQGSKDTVVLLSAIALFILLIAAINFTNLSVAASRRRDREVGIRKTAGAARSQLIVQFIGEATVTTLISMVLALVLVELALPSFNSFIDRSLSIQGMGIAQFGIVLGVGCLFIGFISGSYPALYLSSLRPVAIFRGGLKDSKRKSGFRSWLVILQFSIAVTLMMATVVVFRQISFVQSQDLGYDSENVLLLPVIRSISQDFEPFREQLLAYPDVISVTQSHHAPFGFVIPPSDATAYYAGQTEVARLYPAWVDHKYFTTFDIPLVYGRDFDINRVSDRETALILNETAARNLGWNNPEDAVGEEVFYGGAQREVIGIARDFHEESLQNAIIPMGFYQDARNFRSISLRFSTTDFSGLIDFLNDKWRPYRSNQPLSYDLLDERIAGAYESEQRLGQLFGMFALLGIFVSSLGLFGIAAVTIERRRKEIGIRKAIGASTSRLVYSISVEFVQLTVIALAIGGVAGYFLMSNWLENFAYNGGVGWISIAIVVSITMASAIAAVCFESISAAQANPVESLRYE